MVAARVQLEEISIKGLEVIVSPSCAHLANVRGISYKINELQIIFVKSFQIDLKT